MKKKSVFVLFAKAPIKGYVKTRLAKTTSDDFALQTYNTLLLWQKQNIQDLLNEPSLQCDVFIYTPALPNISYLEAKKKLREIFDDVKIKFRKQPEGNLGTKMEHTFSELSSYTRVTIFGADAALLTLEHFLEASQCKADCCVAPALDGGYGLISIKSKKVVKGFMNNIPWSTNKTLSYQLKNLQSQNISYHLQPILPDLDNSRDLLRVLNYMNEHPNKYYDTRMKQAYKGLSVKKVDHE